MYRGMQLLLLLFGVYPEPGEHQLLRREFRTPDLVVDDQGPNKAQNQLQVAVYDVNVACITMSTAHHQSSHESTALPISYQFVAVSQSIHQVFIRQLNSIYVNT